MFNIRHFIKRKIVKPIKSTFLCLRYPFLYPRNRFTGKHYNNWKIYDYCDIARKKCIKTLYVRFCLSSDNKNSDTNLQIALNGYYCNIVDGVIHLFYNGDLIEKFSIYNITESYSSITDIGFKEGVDYMDFVVVFDKDTVLGRKFMFVNHITDRWIYFKMCVAKFVNDYILQILHCIPKYTEIDVMKNDCYGWYKRFGKQLLKDMKRQLKKDKMLYSFRITQIKEKYGTFRLYYASATKEMSDLISKYTSMSEHICIDCGDDADVITSVYHWRSPYCRRCYEKNHSDTPLEAIKTKSGEWKYCEND